MEIGFLIRNAKKVPEKLEKEIRTYVDNDSAFISLSNALMYNQISLFYVSPLTFLIEIGLSV